MGHHKGVTHHISVQNIFNQIENTGNTHKKNQINQLTNIHDYKTDTMMRNDTAANIYS